MDTQRKVDECVSVSFYHFRSQPLVCLCVVTNFFLGFCLPLSGESVARIFGMLLGEVRDRGSMAVAETMEIVMQMFPQEVPIHPHLLASVQRHIASYTLRYSFSTFLFPLVLNTNHSSPPSVCFLCPRSSLYQRICSPTFFFLRFLALIGH